MPAGHEVAARRGWRIGFVLGIVAFMAVTIAALVSTVRERTRVYAMSWGAPSQRFEEISSLDLWSTFGRLSLLAVGVWLAFLIARGDRRVRWFYVGYGVATLAFEAMVMRA